MGNFFSNGQDLDTSKTLTMIYFGGVNFYFVPDSISLLSKIINRNLDKTTNIVRKSMGENQILKSSTTTLSNKLVTIFKMEIRLK